MGKQYEEPFRRLLLDLGLPEVRAFIDSTTIHSEYETHIAHFLAGLGAIRVETVEAANLVVTGYEVRKTDGVVGLAIRSLALGSLVLFPDGVVTTSKV